MRRHEKKSVQRLVDRFCAMTELADVARIVGIEPKKLSYLLYKIPCGRERLYKRFTITKKRGGERIIHAPIDALQHIQQRLNHVLRAVYWEKKSVHGFLKDRSIITNALCHRKKRLVFNIDLCDFFPSINFGRVRGLFIAAPYSLPPKVATILAQIACVENSLPQGSPCSPIISNMICSKLDSQLENFSKKNKLYYTRYADDLTFSTNLYNLPKDIITFDNGKPVVGLSLNTIIKNNGFTVNDTKTSIMGRYDRQEVTGLTVNQFANVPRNYIRNIRAALYKWRTKGLEFVEKEYQESYRRKNTIRLGSNFQKSILGKINHVCNVRLHTTNNRLIKNHKQIKEPKDISLKLLEDYADLYMRNLHGVVLRGEGKTDFIHLRAAWNALSMNHKFDFSPSFFDLSHKHLPNGENNINGIVQKIKQKKISAPSDLWIFIYDRDLPIPKDYKSNYKKHCDGVYSVYIPEECCTYSNKFSIELLYDKRIFRIKDENNRRLFLSDEFDEKGIHKEKHTIFCPKLKGKTYDYPKVIDSEVFLKKDEKSTSIAMSKAAFAKKISSGKGDYSAVNFDNFLPLFNLIKTIYSEYLEEKS